VRRRYRAKTEAPRHTIKVRDRILKQAGEYIYVGLVFVDPVVLYLEARADTFLEFSASLPVKAATCAFKAGPWDLLGKRSTIESGLFSTGEFELDDTRLTKRRLSPHRSWRRRLFNPCMVILPEECCKEPPRD